MTPEEIKAAKEAEAAKKADEKKKAEAKEADLVARYNRFAELKFLMYNPKTKQYENKRLKEGALKEFNKLEKEFKTLKSTGKPKESQTVYMGIGIANQRIVEGYCVPKTIEKLFKDNKKYDSYFG